MQDRLAFASRLMACPDQRPTSRAASLPVRLTCLFASFVFLQFTVLGLANHAGEGFLATEQRVLVYYALQVFVISGFLLHAAFAEVCARGKKGSALRNKIAYVVYGPFFACVMALLLADRGSLFYVAASMLAAMCLGAIGGAAHMRMSREALAGEHVAACMGIGSAAAVVLQYLLQIRWGVSPLLPVFLLGSLFLLAFLLLGEGPETVDTKARRAEGTTPRRILCSALIAAVFVLFTCFYNEYIHHLQIQSDYGAYNVYSWPRLMLVPGYLLFAAIGDRRGGRYVPVASLCIMLAALLTVVLIQNPGLQWLSMCLFYFTIASFTSYYLLTFWRLAQGTMHPALWAPFGRMLDSGMVLFAGAIHLSALPAPVVLGADLVGGALVILLMATSGSLDLREASVPQAGESQDALWRPLAATAGDVPLPASDVVPPLSVILSEEEALDRMRQRYDLTPREAEVLRELVLTDGTQAAISERLSIQVRTLQNHVTRIYRKTGVATRAGLSDLYYEARLGAKSA